jgi:tetratricopeptide (TPR) repeat protein
MKSFCSLLLLSLVSLACLCSAQERSQDDQPHVVPRNLPEPKEEPTPVPQQGESSSKESQTNGRGTGRTSSNAGDNQGSVHELKEFDPHKAAKDVEVGEYYLKRKNYRAALDRFNEALLYKPNDGQATFRLAQTQEKLELYALAYRNYQNYLNTIAGGPFTKEAEAGIKRLEPHLPKPTEAGPAGDLAQLMQEGEAYLAKNSFESAHENFAKALEIAPDNPICNFRLAQSLEGLERLDEARIYYKKYLALQPNGNLAGDAKRQIGQINVVLGKP